MFLKVNSNKGTIITYINLKNCFSIKSYDADNNFIITFMSSEKRYEQFSFDNKKDRDEYLKFLEDQIDFVDDETAEEEEDILDSDYDPMSNLK